jgi:hypothetical protein
MRWLINSSSSFFRDYQTNEYAPLVEGPIPNGSQPNERQDSLERHARWIVVEAMIGRAHE